MTTGIEYQIAYWTLRVRIERMRRHVRSLVEQRRMKMPNLQAVGPALAKLQSEIEDDARKFVEGLDATRARKQNVFENAKKHVVDADSALTEINAFLTDLDKATNGGPTSGGSSPPRVSADPSETAKLPDVK